MIVLAIISTILAAAWALLVVFANGMSDAHGSFQLGWTIVAAWIGAVAFWLAWWFK